MCIRDRCGAVLRRYSISFPTNPEQTEMEDFTMTTINLKDFYYWYTQDQLIEVSDEVAEVFLSLIHIWTESFSQSRF